MDRTTSSRLGRRAFTRLAAGGALALATHPEERAKLAADRALMPRAVEEMLRWGNPVASFMRMATRDTELRGTRIAAGQRLLLLYTSANRDDDHFADPDVLDLTRDPNPHVAFAFGAHYCLGNKLARMEGQLAFEGLARRFSDIRLADGAEISYKPTQSLRGLRSLPVVLTPS